ncbi:hypothetical protein [Methanobrevibacter sp.]|uniref:hypothetical protein n=1 Tax=Methanobrevibacter sp. TaxID=66852 RepID=UPI00388E436F
MSNIDYFNFENKDLDFPVYDKNPHIPKRGWVVLLIAMFAGFMMQGLTGNEMIDAILFCFIVLIPLLYYLKWDYRALFQKPKAKEVGLAVALFIGYIIYSLIVGSALDYFSLTGTSTIEGVTLTFASIPPLLFSLMGEELIKLIPFLFFLRLFFKFSNNRKLSIVAAMTLVMVFFAMLHLMDLRSLLSVLLIQGLGSIFEFYGYIKTKNVFISYTTHLLTDVFIFTLVIMGVA